MHVWKMVEVGLPLRQPDALSGLLGDWLREALAPAPPGPVEVETNLGGYDEAGALSPDFEWAEPIVREFPHLPVRVTYHFPRTSQESIPPYEVRARWANSTRRAWIEVRRPSRWTVLED